MKTFTSPLALALLATIIAAPALYSSQASSSSSYSAANAIELTLHNSTKIFLPARLFYFAFPKTPIAPATLGVLRTPPRFFSANFKCEFYSSSSSSTRTYVAQATEQQNASPLAARQLYELGTRYQHGKGVEKDEKRAVELYKQAVQLGEPMAFLQLGYCYTLGEGVPEDGTIGLQLYKTGAALLKTSNAAVHHSFTHLPQITKLYCAQLPCKHYLSKTDLDQALQGRAEGQLPICPTCKKSFKTDQIISILV
jgi:TPR repeat protein